MKNKLLVLLLLIIFSACEKKEIIAQIPDQPNFCLGDVLAITGGSCLSDAFTNSDATYFNLTYGNKTMNPQCLCGFRDYKPRTTYDDWSLPALALVDAMYINLYALSPSLGNFHSGFLDGYYSSTLTNDEAANPWIEDFSDRGQYPTSRNYSNYVRAMRKFLGNTGTYSITGIGPAGGLIFYIDDNEDGTSWFFECAPSDQSGEFTGLNYNDAVTACQNLVIYH